MKGKATSFDIAYRAGVSQSTVSRALRNSPLVNEKTRSLIHDIAKELNYKVDKNASSLRSQRSATLALLLFEDPTTDDSLINPFFHSMIGSITRTCANRGYDLLVSFQQLSDDWHADYKDANKADGIILLGYGDYMDYEQRLERLREQGTHFVGWGAVVDGEGGLSVGSDNELGGYDITRHLIQLGRQEFAFLGGASIHCPEFYKRYQGHCRALDEAGLTVSKSRQIDAVTTETSGYSAMQTLLDSQQKFDAVFAASDLIAVGAIRALLDAGVRVPEDVSVVGFDDIPVANYIRPPLTTARQHTKVAGEILVDQLIQQIGGAEIRSELIPTSVVVRDSCGGKALQAQTSSDDSTAE